MLARVADCLYWMNRYLERAEFTARLVSLQVQRLPVGSAPQIARSWRLLFLGLGTAPPPMESLGSLEDDDYLFADGYTLTDVLTFERGNPAAIVTSLTAARENARQVRSTIGPGIWSSLNREFLKLSGTRLVDIWKQEPELLYRDIAEGIQRFHGICDTSMRHGEEWAFLQLGKYVERAQLVGSTMNAHCIEAAGGEPEHGDWPTLLQACNALAAYGHQYGGAFEQRQIVKMLTHDPELPYSLRFCQQQLRASLRIVDSSAAGHSSARPFAILDLLDDLLDRSGTPNVEETSAQTGEMPRINRLYGELHDALEQSYVYYPLDARYS